MKLSEMSRGQRIRHTKYGMGTVEDIDTIRVYAFVTFDTVPESAPLGMAVLAGSCTEVDQLTEAELDKEAAIKLLQRHGYAFRIWGPVEVRQAVKSAWGGSSLGSYHQPDYDVETHMDKIVAHIMGTDDWKEYMSSPAMAQENVLDRLIDGVFNDHPEWFPETPTYDGDPAALPGDQ